MKIRLAAWSVGLTVLLGACKVYNPSLATPVSQSTMPPVAGSNNVMDAALAPTTGADAATSYDPQRCSEGDCWWSHANGDMCRMASAPTAADRPTSPDDGAASVPDIYVGWTQLRIGTTRADGTPAADAWQSLGFDLDGVCTNSASCKGPSNVQSCKPATAQIPFDGELCRDNSFASLQQLVASVPEVGSRFGISEDALNCNLFRGTYTIVLKISGYSGENDDAQVRVDYYASPGLEKLPAWQCAGDDFRSKYPIWRVSSEWRIDSSALMQPIAAPGSLPNSNVADPNAYVRGGYLVAQLPPETTLRLIGDANPYRGLALKTQQGLLVGNLYRAQDSTWHIRDGLAAGRVRSADLVTTFRQVGLCNDSLEAFYGSLVEYATDNADVLSDGANDPSRPCDAVSMGIGFEAAQITPGTAADVPPLVECCKPGVAFEDCAPSCGDGRVNGDEKCDTAIADGMPGACPKTCPAKNACTPQVLKGTQCYAECTPAPITMVGVHDGCCPPGANATADPDCTTTCGNMVVEPGETCDPPGSCPVCPTNNACLVATASGSAQQCTASCEVTAITACKNGDGSCPSGCTRSNDNDCSKSCGNGTIDPGETCETTGATPCPTTCDDGDNSNCTTAIKTGSVQNCNVTCTPVTITTPRNGDMCCPAGGNTNNDSDCTPRCGNGQLDGSEQCDDANVMSGDGCSATCTVESPAQICLANIGDDNACSHCNCDKCLAPALACFIGNHDEVVQCRAVLACGIDTNCRSDQCYCGTSGFLCALPGQANGPCRDPIQAAARSSDFNTILGRINDNNYPIGRAYALSTCALNNCQKECGVQQ